MAAAAQTVPAPKRTDRRSDDTGKGHTHTKARTKAMAAALRHPVVSTGPLPPDAAGGRDAPCRDGAAYGVFLDGKLMRTPGRALMALPNPDLALAIAEEWRGQGIKPDPATLPLTTLARTAIDRVMPRPEETAAGVAQYGAHDLLCYRVTVPTELAQRQELAWDEILHWAATHYGVRLVARAGTLHPHAQDPHSLSRLEKILAGFDGFALTALEVMTAAMGSVILALAVAAGRLEAGEGFRRSRIEEDWQVAHWGADGEAANRAERTRRDVMQAARFLALTRA